MRARGSVEIEVQVLDEDQQPRTLGTASIPAESLFSRHPDLSSHWVEFRQLDTENVAWIKIR
jgi:hypothetical protein